MHSHARLTYTDVWDALSVDGSEPAPRIAGVMPHLRDLYALYETLSQAREARGAIDVDTTETYIVCDPNGRIEKILPRVRNDAHKTDRGMHAGGQRLCGRLPLNAASRRAFTACTKALLRSGSRICERCSRRSGCMLEGGGASPEPADYARLLKQVRQRPDAQLLQTVLLRSMQQAIYSPHNRVTSGWLTRRTRTSRRRSGAIRICWCTGRSRRLLDKRPFVPTSFPATPDAAAAPAAARAALRAAPSAQACSGCRAHRGLGKARAALLGQRAPSRRCVARRRSVAEKLLHAGAGRRDVFRHGQFAVVPFGVFIVLDDLFVEGMVHVSELGSEYFLFNEAAARTARRAHRICATAWATDLIVQVARVDLEARRIEFRMVKGDTRAFDPSGGRA
jgi:ribonuclease R